MCLTPRARVWVECSEILQLLLGEHSLCVSGLSATSYRTRSCVSNFEVGPLLCIPDSKETSPRIRGS